jgi:hypothetical protein
MEYSGSFFPMCSFLRNLNARVLQQSIEIDRLVLILKEITTFDNANMLGLEPRR